MEDDEEYSYTGYSPETASTLRRNAAYVGDDEEYSFKGFADETAATQVEEKVSYGDFIIEEFSTEVNVQKVTKLTRLSETAVTYAFSAIYLIVGVLCVAFTAYIRIAFHYIVGGFMAVIGLVQFTSAIRTKEYVHTHSNKTASSLIMMALSVLILVDGEQTADLIIAVAWGFLGLFEAAHAFNHAISRIARSERCIYYLAKGLIELALAFILLYDPLGEHLDMHIMVLGINLIFDSVTMFPPIKRYLSKK